MQKRELRINGKTYALLLPAVRKCMPLCTRVALLIGPTLVSLGKEIKTGGMEAFGAALTGVDPDKLDKLSMEAVELSNLCCDNQSINTSIEFERHFSQHRGEVYQVCAWALWECVRDFFPQLEAFAQVAKKAALEAVSKSLKDGPPTTGLGVPFGQDAATGPN